MVDLTEELGQLPGEAWTEGMWHIHCRLSGKNFPPLSYGSGGVLCWEMDFPGGSDGKVSAYNAGDPGSIPGSGRSPGEGNGNPTPVFLWENPMNGGAW